MSEADSKTTEAAPAAAAGNGKLLAIAGGTMAVLFAGGFALAYFVLPARLAASIRAELEASDPAAEPAQAASADGHGAPAEGHAAAPDAHAAQAADAHAAPDPHAAPSAETGGHGAPVADGHGGGAPATVTAAATFELRGIIVNVSGPRTGRFVRVSLAFDAADPVLAELARQRARVTDVVSGILAAKSEDELRAPTARGQLRAEFVAAVNPLLAGGQVRNVFFLEYLIQP